MEILLEKGKDLRKYVDQRAETFPKNVQLPVTGSATQQARSFALFLLTKLMDLLNRQYYNLQFYWTIRYTNQFPTSWKTHEQRNPIKVVKVIPPQQRTSHSENIGQIAIKKCILLAESLFHLSVFVTMYMWIRNEDAQREKYQLCPRRQ